MLASLATGLYQHVLQTIQEREQQKQLEHEQPQQKQLLQQQQKEKLEGAVPPEQLRPNKRPASSKRRSLETERLKHHPESQTDIQMQQQKEYIQTFLKDQQQQQCELLQTLIQQQIAQHKKCEDEQLAQKVAEQVASILKPLQEENKKLLESVEKLMVATTLQAQEIIQLRNEVASLKPTGERTETVVHEQPEVETKANGTGKRPSHF